jgi:1-acyl-sn-glycerol-3-phosphate acyltransferase
MMNHWLLKPVMLLALYALLVLLGLISLVWNLAALVLHPLLPRERGLAVGRAGISRGYALFWAVANRTGLLKMDASALDPLRDARGLIVVANHPSMLDALMLVARLPRSACVMKASLAHNPFLGPGARLARYIRNDSALGMVRMAVADLKAGGQLVLFPEGTRTTDAPVNSFRPGFTLIAKLARTPIQAVIIDTESPYLRKGWPLWRLPPLPIEFTVRMGRRFEPAQDADAQLAEIEAYFGQALQPAQRAAAAPLASPATLHQAPHR